MNNRDDEIKLAEAISCMESLHGTLNDRDNDCLRIVLDAAIASQAQQTENHKAKIKAWCNTLEKAADNFERQGYSGESSDLLDIKAHIQPLPPAPEVDKP